MNNITRTLDNLINRITMYKLILFGLFGLAGISLLFSAVGTLPYGILRPFIGLNLLLVVALATNFVFAKLYKATINHESSTITALLLFFMFQPPGNINDILVLAVISAVAIVSKFVIAYKERHIFNPAAFGAVVAGISGLSYSGWWIGTDIMFIFVLVLSVLIIRKIHRLAMISVFISTALAVNLLQILNTDFSMITALKDSILSFPILFMAGTMMTEPITTPPRRWQQIIYGLIVGALTTSGLHFADRSMTPELALIIGNLLVFAFFRRVRQPLKLKSISEIGDTIFEYRFKPSRPLNFKPGQYLELTIPTGRLDTRGNRRTFTIASSPTEEDIILGIREVPPLSTFKETLRNTKKNDQVVANNIAGDFLLPNNPKQNLVLIAGGIGITPFRSMLKYLSDNRQTRNITLFYCVTDPNQIVYRDTLDKAQEYGLKIIYVLDTLDKPAPSSWKGETGRINRELIQKHVLDYPERIFYISGPNVMVHAGRKVLKSLKIGRGQIKTDYFSGY